MRILIVENEKEISEILFKLLTNNNFKVDVAMDGEAAIKLAAENKYSLILLAYNLPKKNGRQVCKFLRKNKNLTPIIMLTVRDGLEDKLEMFDIGVDDYITKPFHSSELLARIRSLLRRRQCGLDDIVKVSNLMICKKNSEVRRAKKTLHLTKKEYLLLVYLAEHKNLVISSDVILKDVWDRNIAHTSYTVKTHIMNLRRKIDDGFENKLIHTFSGRGYMLGIKK